MSHTQKRVNIWTAIVLLGFCLFLAGLSHVPVPTVDGAIRASMARSIVETGQWYPTQYLKKTFIDHPPLYVWSSALSFKIFGVNDFAANLPVRLFAFLTVLLTAAIAIEITGNRLAGLIAAIVLCTTRDFILSSVRGYIEPYLEVFFYSAYLLWLKQKKAKQLWPAALSGLCIFLGFFSKGPPALWPLLFGTFFLFAQRDRKITESKRRLAAFVPTVTLLISVTLCFGLMGFWIYANKYWLYWKQYLYDQVINSAVRGRDGAQEFEPGYFFQILLKYYWPWLPILLFAVPKSLLSLKNKASQTQAKNVLFIFVFGAGFVLGFSAVKWKFWYYIAPAYPAFSVVISVFILDYFKLGSDSPKLIRFFKLAGLTWIGITSVFPIKLHHDRVPEVSAFKNTIKNSNSKYPVYFVSQLADHNMIGTSGEWSFNRIVHNSTPQTSPSWVITDRSELKQCRSSWCKDIFIVQRTPRLILGFLRKVSYENHKQK